MASITPLLKGKTENTSIYIRFRSGRKHDYTLSTGLSIHHKNWNKRTKRPKETTAELKVLKKSLESLLNTIQDNLNRITIEGLEPSKKWLEHTLNKSLSRENEDQNAEISYWINYQIKNPNLFENSVGQKGLSANRVKQLKTLHNVFERYQGNHTYKIIEIDQLFQDNFYNWLTTTEGYAVNTAKKFTDDIVSTAKHASRHKIPSSPYLHNIKRIRSEKIPPIVIEEKEIKAIERLEITKNYLNNTRKWVLLGLKLAQRVSDLLSLTEENIHYIPNLDNKMIKCFVFTQKKSQHTKEIVIPIGKEIEDIIKGGFPTKISSQKFNDYIKELCKEAGIETPTKGSVTKVVQVEGKKVKRKVQGIFPKYELISSHTLRKTATTHMYQVLGADVKNITGHSKEETVNIYVNNDRSRVVSKTQKLLKKFEENSLKSPIKEIKLKVIKKGSA